MHRFLVRINLPPLASVIQAASSPWGKPAILPGLAKEVFTQRVHHKNVDLLTKLVTFNYRYYDTSVE